MDMYQTHDNFVTDNEHNGNLGALTRNYLWDVDTRVNEEKCTMLNVADAVQVAHTVLVI